MPSFRRPARLTALALTFAAARAAPAQLFPGRGVYVDTVPYRHLVGLSPLHILFGSLAGDYEQAVKSDVSLGLGATYSGPGSILTNVPSGGYDVDVSGKARYYFTQTAPSGGSVGLVGGFIYSRRPRRADASTSLPNDRTQAVPTLGVTTDYNRFVGTAKRVVLGTGFGVKRRFAHVDNDYERITLVSFTVRLLLGVAF